MKLDSNGYAPSILSKDDSCYLCGYGGDTARHEVFSGVGNRTISKAEGCWVYLCPECHAKVHQESQTNLILKALCQTEYERLHSHDEFMKLFMKNYL